MAPGLGGITEALDDPTFAELPATAIAGALPRLEAAYARMIVRLLRSALVATARATPDEPAGKVLIHPAVKLLLGEPSLSASQAADVIKRLLSLSPDSLGSLVDDRFVKAAKERALTLRPRGGKKPSTTNA